MTGRRVSNQPRSGVAINAPQSQPDECQSDGHAKNRLQPSALYPVASNRDLGENWFDLVVDAPMLARNSRAGQFVQVAVGEEDEPLIRRPFSVCDVLPQPGPDAAQIRILYQVVGPGTRWMRSLRAGDSVDLLGPLGNPLPQPELPDDGELFLVGGGIGVAPLFLYSRELQLERPERKFRVLLGARRKSLLVGKDGFLEHGISIEVSTDDGSDGHHGNVVELLHGLVDGRPAGTVAGIGCGPHGMNVALRDFAVERDLPFWISLENYMPCGFGACFGCVIEAPAGSPTKYRRVCLEGPAFPAAELPAVF